jgi:pyruvate ferredoxin oxidoreductase gamma subunit
MTMHETVWLGRGGQGAFTAARLLGLSAVRFAGLQAMAFPAFGPERRGAPVFAYTRIDQGPIHDRSAVRRADVAVIMDASLPAQVPTAFLGAHTLSIVDAEDAVPLRLPGRILRVPAKRIARELLGSDHTNTVLLGVLIGATGLLPRHTLVAGITAELGTGERGSRNVAAFAHGHTLGRQWAGAPHD